MSIWGSPPRALVDTTSQQPSESSTDECLQDTMSDEVKNHIIQEIGADYQVSGSLTATASQDCVMPITSDAVQAVNAGEEQDNHIEVVEQQPYDYEHPLLLTAVEEVVSPTNQQQRPDSPSDGYLQTPVHPQAESPISKMKEQDRVNNTIHQSGTSPIDSEHCPSNTTFDASVAGNKENDTTRSSPLRLFPTCCPGNKRALLIACTYGHQQIKDPTMPPLRHSHKDPVNLKDLLLEHGYKQEDITTLVDVGDNKETYPTRVNIIKHIKELVNGARAGDSFFIHFSGHGYQTVADEDQFEEDGMDEFIYPCDYHELREEGTEHYILDNLLRKLLVDSLPKGCRLLGLFDCCSSGTLLDLPINDESEGEASIVSTTGAEETLIWRTIVTRGPTLQDEAPSGLIVGTTITEEPSEDCADVFYQVDRPMPANVLKLRRGARTGRKSRSLQPDPLVSAQGKEEERLADDQPSVAKPFSVVEKFQARQAGNRRSQTLPIYLYARRLENRGSVHLLPLMTPRGTEGVSKKAIEDATLPIDTRVIEADVLCIASCRDNGQTYETSRGGVLVQAFCTVVRAARRDGRDMTLKDLKCALWQHLENIHVTGVKSMMENDPTIKAEDYEAPIPQFSYSHGYDCSSMFTMY